jgi:hypothetical protein
MLWADRFESSELFHRKKWQTIDLDLFFMTVTILRLLYVMWREYKR